MNNEISYANNPHHVFRKQVENIIKHSKNEWLLLTFNATGVYVDSYGNTRQLVGEHSMSRFMTGIDWTISHVRRQFHRPKMRFIPFKGGERGNNKQKRVNFHVHAYLEIPSIDKELKLVQTLHKQWPIYIKRSYQYNLKTSCYTERVVKDIVGTNIWYNQRYEGESFNYGTEKILTCKSCLF